MTDITWVGVVGVLLLVMQLVNLYNSAHTASKHAHEPIDKLDARVKETEKHLEKMDYAMNDLKRDVDHAHEKIRENEAKHDMVSKAQNRALLAILLWIKDPQHGEQKIDDAIKAISEL